LRALPHRHRAGAAVIALGLAGSVTLGGAAASAEDNNQCLLGGLPVVHTVTDVVDHVIGVQPKAAPPKRATTPATQGHASAKPAKPQAATKRSAKKAASTPAPTKAPGPLPGLVGTIPKAVGAVVQVAGQVPQVVTQVTDKIAPQLVDGTLRTVRPLFGTGVSTFEPAPGPTPSGGSDGVHATPAPAAGTPGGDTGTGGSPLLPAPTGGRSAASAGGAALIGAAPPNAPSRPVASSRDAGTAVVDGQRTVSYPDHPRSLPAATSVLVGTLLAFLLGVTAVVVTAGYRGRSADRAR